LLSPKQSFPKKERLTHRKSVQELFSKGQAAFLYPLKVLYIPRLDGGLPSYPKILIAVPKKRFKKAVERNRLKRKIREAYRTQKNQIDFLYSEHSPKSMAFIYVGKEDMPYAQLKMKLKAAISKVSDALGH